MARRSVAPNKTVARSRARAAVSTRSRAPIKEASASPTEPLPWITFTLRTPNGESYQLTSNRALQQAAVKWQYVVRNRQRWSAGGAEELARGSRWVLAAEVGVPDQLLLDGMRDGTIEVSIPYTREESGWEVRILPWEYMLSAATKLMGRQTPLTIVRHLERGARVGPPSRPQRVMIVESAPGKLKQFYSFDSERRLIKACLPITSVPLDPDPTPSQLSATIVAQAPDVVHVTGIDAHQGAELLRAPSDPDRHDGVFLCGEDGGAAVVPPIEFARIVNSAAKKPLLVTCNFYHSAARIAALLVAEGAGAAIGFQDTIDDHVAELFFAEFYRAWHMSNWDTLFAFKEAWNTLGSQSVEIHGTGVVLWSARSLLEAEPTVARGKASEVRADLGRQLREEKSRQVKLKANERWNSLVEVQVDPYANLNYSLLHNNRGVFKVFRLRKLREGRINGVDIRVALHVGNDNFPYQACLDLVEPLTDLSRDINVPLTSAISRAVRESVRTSLLVEVSIGDEIIYRRTHRVTLLPVDQWQDDDANRLWLPSFVLPRDPAVPRIIDSAQRYLMALADDAGIGFDGYQSINPKAENATEGVDSQVRALWAALSYEWALAYINPPPTYGETAQRLRTPTQIIEGRRGTCIDLALLLAACLEYVDIYPAVFLLEGHAFPGYWRSDERHFQFQLALEENSGAASLQGGGPGQRDPWLMGSDFYPVVTEQVRQGNLVPIESVWLTQRSGFWAAVEEGYRNLRSKRDFQALIDVELARAAEVTPLPIVGETE
jgi:hypothetical protein